MIFYFSGTGNSYYAAKQIGNEITDELIDISKAMAEEQFTYSVASNERVGFVFPVYFYGIPLIVADFISKLKLEGNMNPYMYGVITCGSTIEGADRILTTMLTKQTYTLNAIFALKMSENYVMMYEMPTKVEIKSDLILTDIKIINILRSIKSCKNNEASSKIVARLFTKIAYPIYQHGRKTRRFYVNSDCTSCGKCAKICPVKAIEMRDGKPVWIKSQCLHCTGCINRCPTEAIQYGDKTKSRRRFENPIFRDLWIETYGDGHLKTTVELLTEKSF
ncbi:MAG: EFR1 family ferrodoxin [Acetobacterium sp.]